VGLAGAGRSPGLRVAGKNRDRRAALRAGPVARRGSDLDLEKQVSATCRHESVTHTPTLVSAPGEDVQT